MTTFRNVIQTLEAHYGTPLPPKLSDPLHLILWENAGYLVDDDRRETAFAVLRKEVGLTPTQIMSASGNQLTNIMKLGGIHAELRAQRLKETAQIVINDYDGDLKKALRLPQPQAIKALKQFPSIGVPGAEKILLFSKSYPVPALESNGLRVLLRLGFGQEHKNYSTSYRSVQEALINQCGTDCEYLIKAHQLLRRHGQQLCRRSSPSCAACPVRNHCGYYQLSRSKKDRI